ncbi:hypothetical protein DUNSADRAFT_17669 [Dunaliella salina]|uniref:RING-type domain-containing protein n=1 Tax=Dunaliella salina TaxID=3046 RepID=A0ABQ7G1B7_DUNSA|nr:hypothetical protein DUNSADRAFT_17669 [Dunaliella salina]|eukprot:KAF5828399.1 hypothetical protein DUNSADRAFT_17669 [Dunaliella salina]
MRRPIGHCLHRHCLQQYLAQGRHVCPLCRSPVNPAHIMRIHVANQSLPCSRANSFSSSSPPSLTRVDSSPRTAHQSPSGGTYHAPQTLSSEEQELDHAIALSLSLHECYDAPTPQWTSSPYSPAPAFGLDNLAEELELACALSLSMDCPSAQPPEPPPRLRSLASTFQSEARRLWQNMGILRIIPWRSSRRR